MSKPVEDLEMVGAELRPQFAGEDEAREKALRSCRQAIRYSSAAIRAIHRQEHEEAGQLLDSAYELLRELNRDLAEHGRLLYAGFVHDAQKEFAEGCITLALVGRKELPRPETLGISNASYLDGLGESVGELRRYILDSMRREDFSRCEELLAIMDATYGVLVSMDFPELLAHGLKRTTDVVRGIIERTRGDLTVSLRQRRLETKLNDLG
ncbi:MAG: haloacid dehalogenase [Dehalococcoidia bacterium]